jgi:hypothetical protein
MLAESERTEFPFRIKVGKVGEVVMRFRHSGSALRDVLNSGIQRMPVYVVQHRLTLLEDESKS